MDAKSVIQNLLEHMLDNAVVLDTETLGIERGSGMHEIATVSLEKGRPVSAKEYLLQPNRTVLTDLYDQDVSQMRHRPGEIAKPVQEAREGFDNASWKQIAEDGVGISEWLSKRSGDYLHLGLTKMTAKQIRQKEKERMDKLKMMAPGVSIEASSANQTLVDVEQLSKSTSSFFQGLKGKVVWGANVGFDCLVGDTLVQCADGSIIELQDWNGQDLLGCEPQDGPYRDASIVSGVQLVKKGKKQCSTIYSTYGVPITASHKHKMFTDKGWQYVEDIEPGNWLLTSSHRMNIEENPDFTLEEYALLGAWLARGVANSPEFTIKKKNANNLALLPETDDTAWYSCDDHKYHYALRCIHKCAPDSCTHTDPMGLLKRAGLGTRLGRDKLIPRKLMRCSDDQLAALMKGLLLAGLDLKGPKRVAYFKHLSARLRKQVMLLLKRIKISCIWDRENSLRFPREEINKIVWVGQGNSRAVRRIPRSILPADDLIEAWHTAECNCDMKHYKWMVNGRLVRDLRRDSSLAEWWVQETLCNHNIDRKQLIYKASNGFFWTKVTKKEDAGERLVYDIEVSSGEFVANGILVHNTKQLSAMVAGYGSQTLNPAEMSTEEIESLKPYLSYGEFKKLKNGESIVANIEMEKIKSMFETYTPDTKEFGYVTGVEVNRAIAKAGTGFGDYTEVFEAYLKHTQPIEGKIVVRDIQHVMRALLDYGRKTKDYNKKTTVTSVDVVTRLMFSMDKESPEEAAKALLDPEKHRALEDALTHETPMIRRTIEMTAAMREVHMGTAAGQFLQAEAAEGRGMYFEAQKLLGMTEIIAPDIEEIRVRQRFQRAAEDLETKGRIPTRTHARKVYKRGIIDSAGNAAEMNMVEHAYVNLRSTSALAKHLQESAAYPEVDVQKIHDEMFPDQSVAQQNVVNNMRQDVAGMRIDAEEEMNKMFEKRKDELLQFDPRIRERQLAGEAQKMKYNLDLSADMIKKAGVKLAVGMGGIAAVGVGMSVAGSIFGENKDTIDSFSYYDYLESQARYSGMYSQGIMDQGTYSDFGSPYRGPVASTAALTNQTLGREEQQFRQDRHVRTNTEAIEMLQNRTPIGMALQMTPFEIERYFNTDNTVRIINEPLMDMQMNLSDMRRNSKDTAKFLQRHSLQFGNFMTPNGTGPLTTMSRSWQSYSGQLMHDTSEFTRKHAYGVSNALGSTKFAKLNNSLAKTYSSYDRSKDVEKAMRDSLANRRARLSNYGKELKEDMARMQRQANKYIGIKR